MCGRLIQAPYKLQHEYASRTRANGHEPPRKRRPGGMRLPSMFWAGRGAQSCRYVTNCVKTLAFSPSSSSAGRKCQHDNVSRDNRPLAKGGPEALNK